MNPEVLHLVADKSGTSVDDIKKVAEKFPFLLSPFLAKRVREGSYSLEALRQFSPDPRELDTVPTFTVDPTGEGDLQPAPSIIRTYHNRLAIVVSFNCMVYCRFCFRKNVVGQPGNHVDMEQLDEALAYIAAHPEINDVLLSGGDPLVLSNRQLLPFLRRLLSIEHVRAIRFDSRALSVRPERIDNELLDFLNQSDRFWFYAHFNHPDDIDHPDVLAAIRRLLSVRVPIFNQCVLLGGVNDDEATLARLMELCYLNKVLPYNLYTLDHTHGAAHFELSEERIVALYRSLSDRGGSHLSGPAQPLLVYVDKDNRKQRAVNCDHLDFKAFLADRARVYTSAD
jgi:KamA family protein